MSQTVRDLKAKGVPGNLRGREHEIVYVVFVPRTLSKLKHPQDVHVVDAHEVMSRLR